jgi:hypothetical protein
MLWLGRLLEFWWVVVIKELSFTLKMDACYNNLIIAKIQLKRSLPLLHVIQVDKWVYLEVSTGNILFTFIKISTCKTKSYNILFFFNNRLRIFSWSPRKGLFEENDPKEMPNLYTISSIAWKKDGSKLAIVKYYSFYIKNL